jgi:SNF2 family DNA or RNA helicase
MEVRHTLKILEMFEKTFSYSLTQDSLRAEQPAHIKIPLRAHQLADIESMREKETQFRTGFTFQDQTFFSSYGILADPVGTGKTLTALAHMSQMAFCPASEQPLSNLHPSSTSAFFSILPSTSEITCFQNLIVVPHILFRQWQDTIESQTTLKSYFFKSLRDLDRDDLVEKLKGVHVALISNTLLSNFMTNLKARDVNPHWQRVFYDEADTIKLPSTCQVPQANFTWYITANYSNLLFYDSYLHSYVCRQLPPQLVQTFTPELQEFMRTFLEQTNRVHFFRVCSKGFFQDFLKSQHPYRWILTVRCAKAFFEQSSPFPPLTEEIIRCQMPPSYGAVEQSLSEEVVRLLHAGDVPGALSHLGVESHTPITFVNAVCAYKQKELDRLKNLYELRQQNRDPGLQPLMNEITRLEEQMSTLSQRLETVSKDSCGICFELFQEKLITPCCNRAFCATCILEWAARSTGCPLCRKAFHPSELVNIGYTIQAPSTPRLPKKLEALCEYIRARPKGKFIVFCRYDFPLTQMRERLGDEASALVLEGNKDSIANRVKDFSAGKYTVLLLNSAHAVAGLNLHAATHCILWHKIKKDEEQQILGRAYRMGRQDPLTVLHLLHERE